MLNDPEWILPTTPSLCVAISVPNTPLSTPKMLNVPIPVTGPEDVVPNPTDVTFINSLPNLIISSRLISFVVFTQISVRVVDILPPLFTKVDVMGENAIGDWIIPSMTKTDFSSLFAIVKRCELPAPTLLNVTVAPPLDSRSLKLLLSILLTNTVVDKSDPLDFFNEVAPTPANVDLGV